MHIWHSHMQYIPVPYTFNVYGTIYVPIHNVPTLEHGTLVLRAHMNKAIIVDVCWMCEICESFLMQALS